MYDVIFILKMEWESQYSFNVLPKIISGLQTIWVTVSFDSLKLLLYYSIYNLIVKQGVMKAINVNKLTSAGCHVKIWIADWFAQLNNKLGGDLKKIRVIGEYMIEIWKAVGMKMEGVEFLWSSDEINSRAHEYWPLVMDIARKNKLPRIIR